MTSARKYELRLKNQTLVEFSIGDGAFGPDIAIEDYDESAFHLMPCGLALSPEGMWNWLEARSIPTNRRNAARICHELGFSLGDVEALYRASLGLSLNDSYWVVPHDFGGTFEECNLFENPFSEAIGMLAVASEVQLGNLGSVHGNTPELTTDGTLRKGWRIVNGARVLYKGASDGFVPGEPISEYLASLIARKLRLDAVAYGIDEWNGEVCSTCADFATPDVSYVPFAVATGRTDLAGALWWCAVRNAEWFEALCNMLAFDALVCNTDRHLANFGLLRDNATGQVVGMAPIFDNGRALFPNVADDDAVQFLLESQLRGPAFGGRTFEELISRFMGQQQVALLEQAAQQGITGNVLAPARRVAALDAFLRRRAEGLAQTPLVNREELFEALRHAMQTRRTPEDGVFRL